jgi:hypothetical protein
MAFTKRQWGIISDLLWAKEEDVRRRALLERRELAAWEEGLRAKYEEMAEEADRQYDQTHPDVPTEAWKRWQYPDSE